MSITTYYTFFDGAVIDPIWRSPWKAYLPSNSTARTEIVELIKFGFNSKNPGINGEPSDAELSDIFETRTISWTIRRSTPQFFLMDELMGIMPKGKSYGIQPNGNDDCCALLAAGIDGWLRKAVTKRTLQAILKLHSFEQPAMWLELPKKIATRVKKLISPRLLSKPLYAWQGPEACQYVPFGFTDYERHNCLGPADTKRFLTFVERAWRENWPVLFLRPNGGGGSVRREEKTPKFRQVDTAELIFTAMKRVRRFKRPLVFRFVG